MARWKDRLIGAESEKEKCKIQISYYVKDGINEKNCLIPIFKVRVPTLQMHCWSMVMPNRGSWIPLFVSHSSQGHPTALTGPRRTNSLLASLCCLISGITSINKEIFPNFYLHVSSSIIFFPSSSSTVVNNLLCSI